MPSWVDQGATHPRRGLRGVRFQPEPCPDNSGTLSALRRNRCPFSAGLRNVGFVAEALAAHVGPDVAIEVVEPLRPVTFRSADAGTFSVLVMPVRPRDENAKRSA